MTAMIFCLVIAGAVPLAGQHIPGIDWKQRETEYFRLIYPSDLSSDAAALSTILDSVALANAAGMPDSDISENPKKWPIILTDRGIQSNGFVQLVPKRSVWYAAPAEDFVSVSDWWLMLAAHEGRHIAQFNAADRGFTRFLHFMYGEYGWGAGVALGLPDWLMEGDAVVAETLLTKEGRGRNPLFTRKMEALFLQQTDLNYFSISNPSFRRHIPNHYYSGYELSNWIRQEYGLDALATVYSKAGSIGLPLLGITAGTKKATEKPPRELFTELSTARRIELSSRIESFNWTGTEEIIANDGTEPAAGDYGEWDSLFDAGDAGILGRYSSLSTPARLCRINHDGEIKPLIRLPDRGNISLAAFTFNGEETIRVVWQSTRKHPVYIGQSVSDLNLADIDTTGKLRRRLLLSGTRYLYPSLSPDGSRLAVVDLKEGGKCRLVILNAESGDVVDFLDLKTNTAAYPSWSSDGVKLVFSLRNDGGRCIAEWQPGEPEARFLTRFSRETVKKPIYAPGDSGIFFTSNRLGIEGLWYLPPFSGGSDFEEPRLVAQRPFGIEEPVLSADEASLIVLEYNSLQGRYPTRLPLPPNIDGEVLPSKETAVSESPKAFVRTLENRDEIINQANREFPEEDYSVIGHSLNFHSWGILPEGNLTNTTGLKLFVMSSDILGVNTLETGATWNFIEKSPGAYLRYEFTGMRPVLGLEARYTYRSGVSVAYHQINAFGTARFPANLGRTGIWSHFLIPSLQAGYIQLYPAKGFGIPYKGVPVLGYNLTWSRLRRGSIRAIQPDLGWVLTGGYAHNPLSGGDRASGSLTLYLPGGPPNVSLRLNGAVERRRANFSATVNTARGYPWKNPRTIAKTGLDYEFPIAYPDWPIGSLIFIQRFRMGLYSDFAFTGDANAFTTGLWLREWSTGFTINMDFSAFNQFDGLSLGFRFNWLWQEHRPTFNLMLQNIAVF